MSDLRLQVQDLASERGGQPVFAGLSFAVERGSLLRVTGANGSGKTTLLRLLAGMSAPGAGSVEWQRDGQPVRMAEAMLFIGHSHACHDSLSVEDNLAYAGALLGLPNQIEAIRRALTGLGVSALRRRRFGSLSQGQKKRVSLARLLLSAERGARAWLLDEPFVALDVDSQRLVAQLIETELRAGGLVLLTSHQEVAIAAPQVQELRL